MISLIKKIINLRGGTDNEILLDYRNVFNTPEGRRVLTHMLYEMRYFDGDVNTEEGHMLRNYATRLLQRLGGLEPSYFIKTMVDGLTEIPLTDDDGNIERISDKGINLLQDED